MRHSGWWPDYVVRLFRRGRARFSDDSVHERVVVDGTLGDVARADHARDVRRPRGSRRQDEPLFDADGAAAAAARQRPRASCEAIARALWAFVRTYVFRAGFLDGREGFMLARGDGRRHLLPLREAHAVAAQSDAHACRSSSPRWKATRAIATRWSRASCARRARCAIDLWSGQGSADMDFGPRRDASIRCSGAGPAAADAVPAASPAAASRSRSSSPPRARSDLALVDSRCARTRAARPASSCTSTGSASHAAQALVPAADGGAAAGHRDPRHDRQRGGRVPPLRLSRTSCCCLIPRPRPSGEADAVPFRRLLYAGAARQDKGFRIVVDLVELLAARERGHSDRGPDHRRSLRQVRRRDRARTSRGSRPRAIPPLTLIRETPSPEAYAANFPGSICLQPYDRAEFRDRVSGVTLDALAHGCPIVATAGTWSAAHDRAVRMPASRSRIRMPKASYVGRRAAIAPDYARYRQRRRFAARAAATADSWAPLLERLGRRSAP